MISKYTHFSATNILEAATIGIQDSIAPVAGVLFSLIAFVSLQSFLDSAIGWLGEVGVVDLSSFSKTSFIWTPKKAIGRDDWSFDLFLSYLFYPFVFFMGVANDEIRTVSQLVGQKTFFNEFVAYGSLSSMIKLREEGAPRCDERGQIQVLSFY